MKKIFNKIPLWIKIILIPVGLYILWNIIGIILVSTKIVDKFPIGFNKVIADSSYKSDKSKSDFDGPHIFYIDSIAIIKQVYKRDTITYSKIDTLSSNVKGQTIICNVNSKLSFETKIKDTLLIEPVVYTMPNKIIAISDIEGEFEVLYKFLLNNKVIDEKFNWTFGNGHLVLNGDFFDRGLHVTECLWLIYDLEQKAKLNGGKVHFILGNHEIMNMNGDIGYVANKYIENTFLIKENYKNWYTTKTELGRWLQTKNIMEKIGEYLFVHGGISMELSDLNLSIVEINNLARPYYFKKKEINELQKEYILFDSETSPFWYRGIAKEVLSKKEIEMMLNKFNVTKMIIGHTITEKVEYLYSERVIKIDTKHSEGISEGLLVENNKEYRINIDGKKFRIE